MGSPPRKTFWHYTPPLPVKLSPYYNWPPKPVASLIYLLKSWNPVGWRFLMFLMAIAIWHFATPPLNEIANGGFNWILIVAARNLVILLTIAGGLHLWLLVWRRQQDDGRYDTRSMNKRASLFHFSSQLKDNIFWSLFAWVFWSFWECLILWAYASDIAPMITPATHPVVFFLMIVLVPIWAGVHFYWFHRLLHVGPLFTHVHSWHHKNTNTGPWSGLAMHPVESFFLFFDTMIFFILPGHPVLAIFLLLHHGVGAPVSHAGFEYLTIKDRKVPLGDFFHQLHHRFFDCNYGTWDTPWDQWFGTFHDGTEEGNTLINRRRKTLSQRQ